MSLLQEITSPVIFSWVEKSLTHPIQRDIFLGKIWIWISSATDLCRWPNETATSKLSRVWHCHPHTYVVVLFSTVSLCDTSTTWACQDSEEFGEHQEGFFTTCQVHCEYSHGLKGLLMTICWNKRANQLLIFKFCRYKDDSDSTPEETGEPRVLYSVEFCFDTDARVAITLYCQAFEEFANGMAM